MPNHIAEGAGGGARVHPGANVEAEGGEQGGADGGLSGGKWSSWRRKSLSLGAR